MKKLMFLGFLFVLIEGDRVIGDALYFFERGNHAVEDLKKKVNEYGPEVKETDSLLTAATARQEQARNAQRQVAYAQEGLTDEPPMIEFTDDEIAALKDKYSH